VEDREDVRVRERRDRERLTLEPGERIRVLRERFREDLDRDLALQVRVVSAVDLAHAAGAERAADLVGAETGSGWQRHELERRLSTAHRSPWHGLRSVALGRHYDTGDKR